MEDKFPLVTIITSTYNADFSLEKCIGSVRAQTYPNYEFIIVDGGSTDKTLDIINNNLDCITKWISEPDNGIYDAWNKGISMSNGEWMCFLGADDELYENSLTVMISELLKTTEPIDYISGKTDIYIENRYLKTTGEPFKWNKFKNFMNTGHNASLHSRYLYSIYGLYNTSFSSSGDYELLLRVGSSLKCLYVNAITSKMSLGGISNSSLVPIYESFRAKRINEVNTYVLDLLWLLKGWILYQVKKFIHF
jgi:glycosyltransferase involved in cell wall biosynthesis